MNCLDDLQASHRFRLNCESSEAILYSIEQTTANDDNDDTGESLNENNQQQTQSTTTTSGIDINLIDNIKEEIIVENENVQTNQFYICDEYEKLESIAIEENKHDNNNEMKNIINNFRKMIVINY